MYTKMQLVLHILKYFCGNVILEIFKGHKDISRNKLKIMISFENPEHYYIKIIVC